MEIVVDVSGILEATERVQRELDREMRRALSRSAAIVANRARSVHNYVDRTANLTNSIMPGVVSGSFAAGTLKVDITAGSAAVNYARYIEEGTRYIQPRLFLAGALAHEEPVIVQEVESALTRAFKAAFG